MRAMAIQRYGSPDVLEPCDLSIPSPGPKQIRIRVRAAAVNPIDCLLRRGAMRWLVPQRFPSVLGFDVAGTVDAIGSKVGGFQRGDRVYARTDQRTGGGYAEQVITGAASVAAMPRNLSFTQAAALPLVSLTALQAFERAGRMRPGCKVLINGASGGVGSAAVQIARAQQAEVTAVCSSAHASLVRELGAQRVLDYREVDFTQGSARYDIIFDVAATRRYVDCRRVLSKSGAYVALLPSAERVFWALATALTRRRVVLFDMRPSGTDLRRVTEWVEAGALRPVIERVLPLEEAPAAHERCESGHTQGKLVLSLDAE